MKCKFLAAFAAIFLGSLATAHSANADWNVNTYNGSYCKQDVPVGWVLQFEASYPDFGLVRGFYNGSTSTKIAVCPVIADEPDSLQAVKVKVYVMTRHKEDRVSCALRRYGPNGLRIGVSWDSREGLGWLVIRSVAGAPYGSYVVWCQLPSGATLTTIRVEEKH